MNKILTQPFLKVKAHFGKISIMGRYSQKKNIRTNKLQQGQILAENSLAK